MPDLWILGDMETEESEIMIPTRERCQACQQPSPVGFSVPDDVWEAVVHPSLRNSILCLPCFISRADEKLIAWDEQIELFPVSLAKHLREVRGLCPEAETRERCATLTRKLGRVPGITITSIAEAIRVPEETD
jgi:hypothetical protein